MDERDLKAILLRFPEDKEIILKKFQESDDFIMFCSDYQLCVDQLEVFLNAPVNDMEKIDEYKELIKELEMEALRYLKKP